MEWFLNGLLYVSQSHTWIISYKCKQFCDDEMSLFSFVTGAGIAINAMFINESFCVTGSDDGFLRLWPLDFNNVFLEAGKSVQARMLYFPLEASCQISH